MWTSTKSKINIMTVLQILSWLKCLQKTKYYGHRFVECHCFGCRMFPAKSQILAKFWSNFAGLKVSFLSQKAVSRVSSFENKGNRWNCVSGSQKSESRKVSPWPFDTPNNDLASHRSDREISKYLQQWAVGMETKSGLHLLSRATMIKKIWVWYTL